LTCASTEGRGAAPACACLSGFFKSGALCLPCSPNCLTCSGTANNCLACSYGKFRTLIAPECGCKVGYYTTWKSNNCLACTTECVNRDNITGQYPTSDGGSYSYGSSTDNVK